MLYRNRYAYILAIHGCPVWPCIGMDANWETYLEEYFPNHYGDGGKVVNCLSAVPSISQVLDATGGFSRLADASFEVIDPAENYFSAFFAANKTKNGYATIKADLKYTDTSITVDDTSLFSAGDELYLPRETVSVDSVDSSTSMTVSRSLYSAFSEGVWSTYNAVQANTLEGPQIVLGGHWNHAGRWVCLYRAETDAAGVLGAPTRIYAGVIDEISWTGRKVGISTRSITSLLASPILHEGSFRMLKEDWYSGSTSLYVYSQNTSNDVTAILPSVTYISDISAYLEQDATSRSATLGSNLTYVMQPTHCEVRGALVATTDAPTVDRTHPALVEYLRLRSDPYLETSSLLICSEDNPNESQYDTIIIPTGRFHFSSGAYDAVPQYYTQYFHFHNGLRGLIIPCTWSGAYWEFEPDAAWPWMDESGNVLASEDRYLCWYTAGGTIKSCLSYPDGLYTDLPSFLLQVMISTGEDVNPYESGYLQWYQSFGLPQWLVDSATFVPIWYQVNPVVTEQKTAVELFEPSLKIAGYSVIFGSSGKLKMKQNALASEGYEVGRYELAQVSAIKPSTTIGYQAPLTNVVIKLDRLGVTYSFDMNNPQSAFVAQNTLSLEDKICTYEYEYLGPVAYRNLYWLSNTIPSTVIKCSGIVGEVGDAVKISNRYVADGDGYGITDRTALQTEITMGPECEARLLLAGNVNLSSFCALAPSAVVDETVGTNGLSGGKIYLTSEHDQEMNFTTYIYSLHGSTGPYDMIVRTNTAHTTIHGCTLDLATNTIVVPVGWTWPTGFGSRYLESYRYVTLCEYNQTEEA